MAIDLPSTRRAASPAAVSLAGALLAAVLLAGCSGSASERAEPLPATTETPQLYERVLIDSPGRTDHGRHIGFLGNAVIARGGIEHDVTRVYDPNFRIVGFYLGNGTCYRLSVDRSGREIEESLGNHEPGDCIERIFGVAGPFLRVPGP